MLLGGIHNQSHLVLPNGLAVAVVGNRLHTVDGMSNALIWCKRNILLIFGGRLHGVGHLSPRYEQ